MSIEVLEDTFFHFPTTVSVAVLGIRGALQESDGISGALLQDIPIPTDLFRATPQRQLEYRSGRLAALLALRGIAGVIACPPGRGTKGEPTWAPGIHGSITHTNEFAAAAATQDPGIEAIGIDAEGLLADDRVEVISQVALRDSERSLVHGGHFPNLSPSTLALGVISAKECILKCLFARWEMLDFTDIQLLDITPSPGHTFCLRFDCTRHGRPSIETWFSFDDSRVYSSCTLHRFS